MQSATSSSAISVDFDIDKKALALTKPQLGQIERGEIDCLLVRCSDGGDEHFHKYRIDRIGESNITVCFEKFLAKSDLFHSLSASAQFDNNEVKLKTFSKKEYDSNCKRSDEIAAAFDLRLKLQNFASLNEAQQFDCLTELINQRQTEKVIDLVDAHPKLLEFDDGGSRTLLLAAVNTENTRLVNRWVVMIRSPRKNIDSRKAKLNEACSLACEMACNNGKGDCAKSLLKSGASPFECDKPEALLANLVAHRNTIWGEDEKYLALGKLKVTSEATPHNNLKNAFILSCHKGYYGLAVSLYSNLKASEQEYRYGSNRFPLLAVLVAEDSDVSRIMLEELLKSDQVPVDFKITADEGYEIDLPMLCIVKRNVHGLNMLIKHRPELVKSSSQRKFHLMAPQGEFSPATYLEKFTAGKRNAEAYQKMQDSLAKLQQRKA